MRHIPSRAGQLLSKLLLLSLPGLALVISYFVFDPFWVLYHYPTFSGNLITIPNRDYVSTQMYVNTYQTRRYQSFIFGNSRTMAFQIGDWYQYIGGNPAFHFDASSETLYGVWKKLEFIEARSPGIKHALIVCDPSLLKETRDIKTHLTRKDPRLTQEFPLGFHVSFLKAYLSNQFYLKYLKRRLTGTYTPDMAGMLESRRIFYDPLTNDLRLPDVEQEIRTDSTGYYVRKHLHPRPTLPAVAPAVIGPVQLKQLTAIRNILHRQRTNYHFIISPLYYQEQMNPADVRTLTHLFGAERVHNYSGVNRFTEVVGNYYEEYHYRPVVGRQILKAIYLSDSLNSSRPK
ncbi:hypothetical protein I2I05_18455 [Hymenobacter sp. BT683]|uniref:DUF1574 domain-containing protein n=1 Tax=Hymenobacter jeongseonensis TaxID=2791027 RepID=A0ABS0IM32_9BACT|nr:hypothetical protein [Hymenobacter jeongseonensis]MBF9239381.1 hypothetical protein [Hymenobacter jeongseonensis]